MKQICSQGLSTSCKLGSVIRTNFSSESLKVREGHLLSVYSFLNNLYSNHVSRFTFKPITCIMGQHFSRTCWFYVASGVTLLQQLAASLPDNHKKPFLSAFPIPNIVQRLLESRLRGDLYCQTTTTMVYSLSDEKEHMLTNCSSNTNEVVVLETMTT